MGDRPPKSKRRDQQQRTLAKAEGAAAAKSTRDNQSRAPQIPARGKH
jgi:hypothetical protein